MLFAGIRLRTAAWEGVQSVLAGFSTVGGIPEIVWHHPYALGWIQGYARGCVEACARRGNHSMSNTERGAAIRFGLEKVAPEKHKEEALRRLIKFLRADDAEFRRGSTIGLKTCLYNFGLNIDTNDPDIDINMIERSTQALVKGGLFESVDRASIGAV